MRECWINVYLDHSGDLLYGRSHCTRSLAEAHNFVKPIYRIHVRVKKPESLYIQTFGRAKRHA